MNKDLIKGLVKLKLEMMDSFVDQLPETEAEEVRKLGNVILEAVTEYSEHRADSSKKKHDDSQVKPITID
jgi:hypothetical protein